MVKLKNVPFYPNLPDDMHCFQASVRIVLKYFTPKKEFSWKKIEKLTGFKKDLWTWALKASKELAKMGFDIVYFEDFDYDRLANEGKKYLLEKYGREVGEAQAKYSDLGAERRRARDIERYAEIVKRLPSFKDIKKLLKEGYLVGCNVNGKALNGKRGYSGHFVIVFGIDDKHIFLHNPGLPPRKNAKVTRKKFLKAWAYPTEKEKNLMAFRL